METCGYPLFAKSPEGATHSAQPREVAHNAC
jgi:hypothetical protein